MRCSVEQVTQAVQRGKFCEAFIAYAHAALCGQADFDAHYQPSGVSFSYQELRRTIGRRHQASLRDARTFQGVQPRGLKPHGYLQSIATR